MGKMTAVNAVGVRIRPAFTFAYIHYPFTYPSTYPRRYALKDLERLLRFL